MDVFVYLFLSTRSQMKDEGGEEETTKENGEEIEKTKGSGENEKIYEKETR